MGDELRHGGGIDEVVAIVFVPTNEQMTHAENVNDKLLNDSANLIENGFVKILMWNAGHTNTPRMGN